VVADLTHGNKGAYWEAGYATGLGKPVIYTCEQSIWDREKTHFDTNHHLHIPWSLADMAMVVQKLKATIRITIPEAKQQDGDA
jgi:nucleoside 2-deoxyribosyltransferase